MKDSQAAGSNSITTNTILINGEMSYNNVLLLSYKIAYPEFNATQYPKSIAEVNLFYKSKAFQYRKHCETELFNLALEQYKDDVKNDFPIRMFEAVLTFEVTYSDSCIISLYTDTYEYTGGAHGNTVRDSQTFNLQKGYVINLSHLIHCSPDYKTYLLKKIVEQAAKEPEIYFEYYDKLITDSFNKNSFYCTPQGIIIYYQQYDVAPYASGIIEFLIPYSDCVLNPESLCYMLS